jgi:hypothetical protein
MKKLIYLPLVFLSVTALAQDQKQVSTATLCVYRPHRYVGAALKPSVYVDDIDVARLHNGDAVQVNLSPGSHKVYSNDKSTGVELDAKAGQTYFLRVDIAMGAWKGHGQITLIDPQEGKYEFSRQKITVTRDLAANQSAAIAEPANVPSAAANVANPSVAADNPPVSEAPAVTNATEVKTQSPVQQQVQSADQQPSLGDVARQYHEKKARPQNQQGKPQN